jgi:Fe-S cluster biogenesis protein NfuA/nitrite reductase/ring-hydroxylating ferredoxin subunit
MQERKVSQQFQQMEELIARVENISNPELKAGVQELLQMLMELHGAGLQRILEKLWEQGESGRRLIEELGHDSLVGPLLLLYGIHPLDLQTRVEQALEKVRPYLKSHGGDVQILEVTGDGRVRLGLQGSCHGCPSSSITMKLAVEDSIYDAAPDVTELFVEGMVDFPLSRLQLAKKDQPNWQELEGVESIAQGTVSTLQVQGTPVLVCSIDGTYYAYSNDCPACGQNLHGARLEAVHVICPSCAHRFDASHAGKSLEQPTLFLQPFPLLVEQGRPKIALMF